MGINKGIKRLAWGITKSIRRFLVTLFSREPKVVDEEVTLNEPSDLALNEWLRLDEYTIEAFTTVGEHVWTIPEGIEEVDVLIVAGGGGGGLSVGGGGAGGLVFKPNYNVSGKSQINLKVGAGGDGAIGDGYNYHIPVEDSENGENSFFDTLEAIGGGAGGCYGQDGVDGGSGGGASGYGYDGGIGVINQGHDGSEPDWEYQNIGGGGGGASTSGLPYLKTGGGDGLNEVTIDGITYNFAEMFGTTYGEIIEGEAWFAGGGGGGNIQDGLAGSFNNNDAGKGGKGGGGQGQNRHVAPGSAGQSNTGGGGGGNDTRYYEESGYAGGSGIILIRYRIKNRSEKNQLDETVEKLHLDIDGGDYYSEGYRISNPIDISKIAKVDTSNIKWQSTEPTDTDIKIYTSVSEDGHNPPTSPDWYEATNDSEIPEINENDDLSGKYLWIYQELSTQDVTKTPELESLEIEVQGSSEESWFHKNTYFKAIDLDKNGEVELFKEGGEYKEEGYRISNPISLDEIKNSTESNIKWTEETDEDTDIEVYCSINKIDSEPGILWIKENNNDIIKALNKRIIAFTAVGTHNWLIPAGVESADVLIIGGGGGGGAVAGGGGGAGEIKFVPNYNIYNKTSAFIKVGAGGIGGIEGGSSADNGGESVFEDITAIGGGAGGNYHQDGVDGGSGGGGAGSSSTKLGGIGLAELGNDGGNGHSTAGSIAGGRAGGGGGGASQQGENASGGVGGDGGDGLNEVTIDGITYNFAEMFGTTYGEIIEGEAWFAGGGGGSYNTRHTFGIGGKGGGASSIEENGDYIIGNGSPNTGGGGAGSLSGYDGGDGGSGIILISYNFTSGVDLSDEYLWCKQILKTSDIYKTPILKGLEIEVKGMS